MNRTLIGFLIPMMAFAACVRRAPESLSAFTSPPADPREGTVSYQALADPNPNPPKLTVDDRLFVPSPFTENPSPVYPRRPLESGAGDATVIVRIVVAENGQVTVVGDSPLMASTPGPFAADFRAAVEDVVWRWRFRPARVERFEKGKDFDGDGKVDYSLLVGSQEIPFYLDIRFDFRIVDGKGVVITPAPVSASLP